MFKADAASPPGDRFLYVGRFVGEKGLGVLLRSVARCASRGTPVALDLVGSGPLEAELRRAVHDLGIEQWVAFRGRMHGKELASAIRKSIAVVVPSTWDEAFGIVAAEAISCGRLAVVSDAGGLPEVVEGTECVVPSGDENAWARMLVRVKEDCLWREQMEARLPAIASRFTEHNYVEAYIDVYERALQAA